MTDLSLTMLLTGNTVISDRSGLGDPTSSLDFSFVLDWGANTFITLNGADGRDTGQVLRGLRGVSQSGFDFLGDQGVAAVPEPTSWALMISGFAATGATLRRRRRTVAPI
jgi:hypothetical protein